MPWRSRSLIAQSDGRVVVQQAVDDVDRRPRESHRVSLALNSFAGQRITGVRERIVQRDGIWHDPVFLERRSPVNSPRWKPVVPQDRAQAKPVTNQPSGTTLTSPSPHRFNGVTNTVHSR
ncbi:MULTISPECIES: hypothetical protein [Amycolatopsis]|uniref:Uncharacterized protein n=1 Tax=Amycolatopsis albidoflavus TaxID=102226 RepID=A0ABW5IG02_9PSEU